MIVTIAPMCVDYRDVTILEWFAPDLAIEVIQALPPAPHQLTQQDLSVLVEGGAEHVWHRQDDMAIDHALMQGLAHLADPVVHVDFGTPQAQRRFTAHRHEMLALTTVETSILDIAHLVGVAAIKHLVDETVIVGRVVARTEL